MQAVTVLNKLPLGRITNVTRQPKRAIHTITAARRQARAQSGDEGGKGEGSNVPSRRDQAQGQGSQLSPMFPSTVSPFTSGRLGSVFKELEDEMNQLTRAFGISPFEMPVLPDVMPRGARALACDVHDKGDHLEIAADVPGMTAGDLKITVSPDNVLSISGERKFEKKEEKEGEMFRMERSYGSFMRKFKLPPGANAEGIKAETKDGVLRLTVPKAEEKEHKVINIKVGESSS